MRILFVENHHIFAGIVIQEFLSLHEVTVTPSLEAARAVLKTVKFDLALVDYDLDDGKGDQFVRYLITEFPSIPAIAVSAHDRGNEALRAAGAMTTCAKTDFGRIQLVIEELFRRPTLSGRDAQ